MFKKKFIIINELIINLNIYLYIKIFISVYGISWTINIKFNLPSALTMINLVSVNKEKFLDRKASCVNKN